MASCLDRVLIPAFQAEAVWRETEVFGAMAWLWMHSPNTRHAPLWQMASHVLPAIKHRQFALFFRQEEPVGYISWAGFDEATQQRYIADNLGLFERPEDWISGHLLWFIDWVAPFGDSAAMRTVLSRHYFADKVGRSLYHHGRQRGLRVMSFCGSRVAPQDRQRWKAAAPWMDPLPIHAVAASPDHAPNPNPF